MLMTMSTSSPSIMPPVSIILFQTMPKSLRLAWPVAVAPARLAGTHRVFHDTADFQVEHDGFSHAVHRQVTVEFRGVAFDVGHSGAFKGERGILLRIKEVRTSCRCWSRFWIPVLILMISLGGRRF